tara:strand:- start:111 stop:599 length:489 start_codon:yes stop_codon:yes gene_type:complete
MKKIVYLLLLICSTSVSAQKFEFTVDGFTDYIVEEFPSKSQLELYNLSKMWVMDTYKNPDEVLKADFEGERIRIFGGDYSYTYQIEIAFKDGRVKFDPISLEKGSSLRIPIPFDKSNLFFNKKGKAKYMMQPAKKEAEEIINDVFLPYVEYLKKGNKDKNDW